MAHGRTGLKVRSMESTTGSLRLRETTGEEDMALPARLARWCHRRRGM